MQGGIGLAFRRGGGEPIRVDRAEPEHADRDVAFAEETEIFRPHHRFGRLHIRRAKSLDQGGHEPIDEFGRVDRRRRAFLDVNCRLGGLVSLRKRLTLRLIDSINCSRTGSLNVRSVSWSFTSSGMMLCLVPPWIEPTVTTAGSTGLDLPADDRLEIDDDERGQDDRIDRAVGPGTVAALALDGDVD